MEMNSIYKKLVRYSCDMLCATSKDGHFVAVSDACRHLLGYDRHELEGRHFTDFIHPEDKAATLQAAQQFLSGQRTSGFRNRYLHKDGHEVPMSWSVVRSEEEELLICTGRETTAQQQLQKPATGKEAFYKALVDSGVEMMILVDEEGAVQYVNGATTRILGYVAEELLCLQATGFVHPDDLEAVQESWAQLYTRESIKLKDFRVRTPNGEWRWIEALASNQLQQPAIRAFVVSLRDITERKTGRLQLEVSEQRYRALFENNPDIVIFENPEGLVTEVNQAFRNVFGTGAELVIGKPASAFLPPDLAALNARSLQEALLGSTLRYDLNLSGRKRPLVLDTVKFPVPVGDKVIGAQTIAKDITPIVRSFETIERQAKKLHTIFESITDGFFTLDKNWTCTYANSEFEKITGYREQDYAGRHLLDLIEDGTENIFYRYFQQAADSSNSVHFEAYSRQINKWLEVKAYPSEEGIAVYFSDITEKVKAKQEVERLSLVASKTDNAVVITDAGGLTEWVNDGFTRMTGYTLSDMLGRQPGDVLQGEETEKEAVRQIEENLARGVHFNAQLLNYRKSGEKFWVSMDITPILDEAGTITRFIAIQKDITYRKEAEASLVQMTQELYRQNKDLQAFTYIISHNLRAPVANALGLAHLLSKTDRASAPFSTYLAYLKKSVLQMDTVLKDVNQILTVRDKGDMLKVEEVGLADVFRQALTQLQESLHHHEAEVISTVEEELQVHANKAYVFSIFFNLLSNAIKFRSDERRLRITLQRTRNADGSLTVAFSDNGIGFDTERAGADVFKLYKRFHPDRKGRGMGLFLVRTHAEVMGWKVEVRSQVNEGTTFRLHIPAT